MGTEIRLLLLLFFKLGPGTWLFPVCGAVLIVGGWWRPRYVKWLLDMGPDDPIIKRYRWLPGVIGSCQLIIGAAWILTFFAMAGKFNQYMFGPFPDGDSSAQVAAIWLRLLSGIAFMLGFVGTAARWAWHRGYKCAEEGSEPPGISPFDF